jgi:uncharacterized protein
VGGVPAIRFTAALLKVASRCNLKCDYCYVYQHADQSWRDQPHFMSEATLKRFAERLDEYIRLHGLPEFTVTFHGGEPLLLGADRLAAATGIIREIVSADCSVEFSLQSNGTLLTEQAIDKLEAAGILVSVSLDGPPGVNDRHRLDHGSRSTFDATLAGIKRLQTRRSAIFRGVIAVIDPAVDPQSLFEFFAPMVLPRLDFLLPDATYLRQPAGRADDQNLYLNWLRRAFTLWFEEFPNLPIRWFDAVLASRLGVPSPTDAMGLGSVSLLVIDTDGSYTDHDVFKITRPGGPALFRNLDQVSFEEISAHPALRQHAGFLTLEGLADECRSCPVVQACGGGSVMHRWHPQRHLKAPSVYCRELFGLMETATSLLRESIDSGGRCSTTFPLTGKRLVDSSLRWRQASEEEADCVASSLGIARNGTSAAAILLQAKSSERPSSQVQLHRVIGKWLDNIKIQSSDPWLVCPFAQSVKLLETDSSKVEQAYALLQKAEPFLAAVDVELPMALGTLISDILFVESTIESDDQIFSFSDDSAPNVLYIAPFVSGRLLDPEDFADSILHEFLHHVLYHLEKEGRMLLDNVFPQFPAPWRSGLRPAAGFFHGTFVFAMLSRYWESLLASGQLAANSEKASANATRFRDQAVYGIASLRQFALLTSRGSAFLDVLANHLSVSGARITAPGISVI